MTMEESLATLHQKIDHLTEQFEQQRRRQEQLDELKDDIVPIANQLFRLAIDELAEIGSDFELQDLLFLLKRLLRNTRSLTELLDRMEAAMGMGLEVNMLGKQVFSHTVETLDRMEREGYFDFARGGWYLLERIVSEFSEEDVRALGDNIVHIMSTVRSMTQPEILAMANRAIEAIRPNGDPEKPPSVLSLMRELSDPNVRLGMARMLNLVKVLAEQPASE